MKRSRQQSIHLLTIMTNALPEKLLGNGATRSNPVKRYWPGIRMILIALTVLGVNLLAIYWQDIFGQPRYLLIHSDDAGMCHSVNLATIDAMEKGVVSSASILVNSPGFAEIANYARNNPTRDFGVHLHLTCEVPWLRWGPLLPREQVPSLVRPDGSFWPTSEEVATHARLEEVEMELRAQIDMALKAGIRVSHLDHHMFVLLQRPDLLNLYIRLGKHYDLPVRLHREFPEKEVGSAMLSAKDAYQQAVKEQQQRRMPLLDFIETDNYNQAPRNKLQYFLETISDLAPGQSEILIHCGYNRPEGPLPPHASRREADTQAFMSAEIRDALQSRRIKIVTWRDLQRMNQAK
ncbi:MAG: polysaccharide deacetylase family protein [Planctomycetales bacterium]